uniref:Uncharacterized protein n=1 Tax=Anguilla anguilla TaxID=7936 RepID=A0A0E9T5I1_ANGAN
MPGSSQDFLPLLEFFFTTVSVFFFPPRNFFNSACFLGVQA